MSTNIMRRINNLIVVRQYSQCVGPVVFANRIKYYFQTVIIILLRTSLNRNGNGDRFSKRNGIHHRVIQVGAIQPNNCTMSITLRAGCKSIRARFIRLTLIPKVKFINSRFIGGHIGDYRTTSIPKFQGGTFPVGSPGLPRTLGLSCFQPENRCLIDGVHGYVQGKSITRVIVSKYIPGCNAHVCFVFAGFSIARSCFKINRSVKT